MTKNPSFPASSSFFQLGLIGYPLEHSLSPKIHAAALKACGLSGGYALFAIPPQDSQGLKDLIARVRAREIHGLNVTIPHKQSVIEFMDELTPTAKAIGAANTIYLRENKLIGENTDAAGFLADLKKFTDGKKLAYGKSALVLGAGGAARAVVYALLRGGWNIALAARRVEQAQELANSFENETIKVINYAELQPFGFDLLVNATPVGMSPKVDDSPLPGKFSLNKDTMVYDLVYNPRQTRLAREAQAQGCSAATGLGMLIEQAALAFEIWTGCVPPRPALWQSIRDV
ncbi:MAG: shikimate dehydrogenase [Chloroflexi bacterium]|nr:shikimate dehydrogenase [Chloroflexota bacterium]MCA2002370.1 shikimate dehydrogenase [Chloroflexota bacterium]